MGISVETYRIRIGHFEANKVKKMKCNKFSVGKIKQSTIFIFSIIILQLCSSCHQPQSGPAKTKSVSKLITQGTDLGRGEIACYLWAQTGLSTNKLQKMINGNRRAVGYKLAVWNCGRGLIQEGFSVKLNEVKHFLRNKRPHCLGII